MLFICIIIQYYLEVLCLPDTEAREHIPMRRETTNMMRVTVTTYLALNIIQIQVILMVLYYVILLFTISCCSLL